MLEKKPPVVFRTLQRISKIHFYVCAQSNSENLLISILIHLNILFSIVAADYNITIFPTAILHESGINGYKIYQKSDLKVETNVTKSAERVKQWIFERLEENDRIVVKAITAEAFKSSPDDFKHVSTVLIR